MFELTKVFKRSRGGCSLREQIAGNGDLQALIEHVLGAYIGALDSAARHLPSANRRVESYRPEFQKAREAGEAAVTGEEFAAAKTIFDGALKRYGRAVDGQLRYAETEIREIVAKFSEMAEAIARRDQQYGVRFRSIAKKLRLLSTCEDLTEIRWKLGEEVEELDRSIEETERDNKEAVTRLTAQVSAAEERRRSLAAHQAGPAPAVETRVQALETMRALGTRDAWGAILLALTPDSPGKFEDLASAAAPRLTGPGKFYRWTERSLMAIRVGSVTQLTDLAEGAAAACSGRFRVHYGVACPIKGEPVERLVERVESLAGIKTTG